MKAAIGIVLVVTLAGVTLLVLSRKISVKGIDANQLTDTRPGPALAPTAIDFNQLVCVTERRIPVAIQRIELCRVPPAIGPHEVPEILIYANRVVLEYKRNHPNNFDYPVGSKFVKTKYANLGDHEPNAATMMVRKASSGAITDWEFTSHSLPDEKPFGPANDPSCIKCHQGFADRGYISWETEGALKRHLHLE